jgi:hypothetical protein
MGISYAHEKLMEAVRSLATGTGSIQDRLYSISGFILWLGIDDFPEGDDFRQRFIALRDRLLWPDDLTPAEEARAKELGTPRVTCDRLTDAEASHIAETICDFKGLASEYYFDQRLAQALKERE